jgi:hypothetical protein
MILPIWIKPLWSVNAPHFHACHSCRGLFIIHCHRLLENTRRDLFIPLAVVYFPFTQLWNSDRPTYTPCLPRCAIYQLFLLSKTITNETQFPSSSTSKTYRLMIVQHELALECFCTFHDVNRRTRYSTSLKWVLPGFECSA